MRFRFSNRMVASSCGASQEGSLLLMSVVLLGTIAFTSIFLSLTLIYEIKSTRFSDNAASAYYAAESGAEDALFRLRRSKEFSDQDFFDDKQGKALCAAEHGGVSGGVAPTEDNCLAASLPANADPERIYDYAMLTTKANDYVAANVKRNSPVFADIYDPAIEGSASLTTVDQLNVDWYLGSCTGQYGSAKLEVTLTPIVIQTYAPEAPFTKVDVCGCTDNDAADGATDGLYRCDTLAAHSMLIPDVVTNRFYRISFRPLDVDVKKIVMTTENAGLPSTVPSQIEIKVTGAYREAQSTINLRGVWKDALSGIFNYIVFSEESLIKSSPGETSTAYESLCGFCNDSSPVNIRRCSSDTDCGGAITCKLLNTTEEGIDNAESTAFCSEETATEHDVPVGLVTILQTDEGSCNALCNGYTFCGDGYQQSPNGTETGYLRCSAGGIACTSDAMCGGVPNSCQGYEECDYGPLNSDILSDACRSNCRNPRCGDGVVDTLVWAPLTYGEECDDGNTINTDSCKNDCMLPDVLMNFQGDNIATPAGFLEDNGSQYGDRGSGRYYGWNGNYYDADGTDGLGFTRRRGVNPNVALDTFFLTANNAARTWQMEYLNGNYTMKTYSGDASFAQGPHILNVEGIDVFNNVSTVTNSYATGTIPVEIRDGRLNFSIGGGGAAANNTMMNYFELERSSVQPTWIRSYNFQTAAATVPTGFTADSGGAWNGTYGWTDTTQLSTRERAVATIPQVLDTLIFPNNTYQRTWELAVPASGTYQVWVGLSDPDGTADRWQYIEVEGSIVIDEDDAAAPTLIERSVTVNVTDGRLTMKVGKLGVSGTNATVLAYIVVEQRN